MDAYMHACMWKERIVEKDSLALGGGGVLKNVETNGLLQKISSQCLANNIHV